MIKAADAAGMLRAVAENSSKAVVVAVGADLVVGVAKGFAAVFSGSASMAAECGHSFVDAANQALLLIGMHKAGREPDETHPFGYGAQLYFWALVVAVVIFVLGGGLTIAEGVVRFLHPSPPEKPLLNYVVYAIAFLADGKALLTGYGELRKVYPHENVFRALHASKDPNVFVVVLEDGAALVGLVIAVICTAVSQLTGDGRPDAIGSLAIGGVLCVVAFFMIREIGSLLTGEAADPDIVALVTEYARNDATVMHVNRVLTCVMGPENVIVAMDVQFGDDLRADVVAGAIDRMQQAIKERKPAVREIFVHVDALTPRPPKADPAEPDPLQRTSAASPKPNATAPATSQAT
jgi:cation diffusion facilitator family transporter